MSGPQLKLNKSGGIAKYFGFEEHGTTLRTEIIAGLTTFFAMAYILVVSPNMLGETGMDKGAIFTATAVGAALGTILMGVIANYPLALAPGLGLIGYFTYAVVLGMKVPWQTALGAVFISGCIFLLLTLFKIRELIVTTIPKGLQHAVSAGVGLFVAFIGLKNTGIVVADEATIIALNKAKLFTDPVLLLTLFGLIVTIVLLVLRVRGAIFLGLIATAIVGMITGVVGIPTGVVAAPPSMGPTFLQLDIMGALEMGALAIVFSFLFVDLFDNAGTLVAVAHQSNFMKNGKLPRAGRVLFTDSIAAVSGSLFGTSTVTSYIESTAGVASGGRTGFTSVITGLCFALSIFFFPIIKELAAVSAVTAPALIVVGILSAKELRNIEWDDFAEAAPAVLTVLFMLLGFSIAEGIAMGFIFYAITSIVNNIYVQAKLKKATKEDEKLELQGRKKNVHIIVYILAILFVVRYLYEGGLFG